MELNEAIDNINLLITNLENMSVKEIEPENYILLNSLNTVLEELNNRISKEKIRNYLDARINIVINDKLNSKDEIQIATDEGIEKLLKMIRQDLLEDKE